LLGTRSAAGKGSVSALAAGDPPAEKMCAAGK
jgi:hypothetical protein